MNGLIANFLAAWRHPKWRVALILAALSDALSFGLAVTGPFQVAGDLVTAVALFAILGFRWPLFIPLVTEAIPAVALFPAWILFVASMAALEKPAAQAPEPPRV